ncbi:hypothetical protein [Kribbella sp. CA-293567]|uniref:hypothetical protein n=1 Tax=Kribbella sp. CA-293567 TaxID=3002436 RepID=UPI0022DDA669|nr:hypothetical protein [Kribbella sp. CA-293567]WBQ04556.1 hypothetical protein OX958_31905 [Kribbella sp. CA-293567]
MRITLSSQAVRRTALAGATVALSVVVAGCGAGFDAQTNMPYQPAEGTNADSGAVAVRNLLVLASADGEGQLQGTFVNNEQGDDSLVCIAATDAKPPADAASAASPCPVQTAATAPFTFTNFKALDLKAGGAVNLPPATGLPVTVTGGKPGQMLKVTLTFEKAGPIAVSIPVLTKDHYSPSPAPEADGEAHG